jgi:hypothetical protein
MIIPGKLTDVSGRLTFVVDNPGISRYEKEDNLSIPVFYRILPCFSASHLSLTRLSPVSECYSSCKTPQEADKMSSKKTTRQRYYCERRRSELAAAGRGLSVRPGVGARLPGGAGTQRTLPGVSDHLLPKRHYLHTGTLSGNGSPARPGDRRPGEGTGTPATHPSGPTAASQSSPVGSKFGRKAHPSHLFLSLFLHRSHIPMLQCLLDQEALAQQEIRWNGPTSGLKKFFKVCFRSVSTLTRSQNATVASNSRGPARSDRLSLAYVSAHKKGGKAA